MPADQVTKWGDEIKSQQRGWRSATGGQPGRRSALVISSSSFRQSRDAVRQDRRQSSRLGTGFLFAQQGVRANCRRCAIAGGGAKEDIIDVLYPKQKRVTLD